MIKRSQSNFVWKHNALYLHVYFGFIATDDTGVPKLQCVVCGVVLAVIRNVEADISQPLLLPLTKNEKTTADNIFLTFVGL